MTTKNNRGEQKFLFAFAFMLLCVMLLSTQKVNAASKLLISVDGVKTEYTGKQVSAVYQGKKINMKNTPGIVLNGTSYVSYKNVFGDSKIGASVSYNSKTKQITIKKYDKTIVMTLGSNIATVNGTKKTMPGKPIKVKYHAKNVTKILVPTEFVTNALGYKYGWSADATTVTAKIDPGLIIKYDSKTYSYTGSQITVTVDGTQINLSTLPSIIIDQTTMTQAKKVFTTKAIGAKYEYNKSKKQVTIKKDDITIQMTLGSKTAYVNGKKTTMPTSARIIKNVTTGKSYVFVPTQFVTKSLGLTYEWDSRNNSSKIITKIVEEEPENNTVINPQANTYQAKPEFEAMYERLLNSGAYTFTNTKGTEKATITEVKSVEDQQSYCNTYEIRSTKPFTSVSAKQDSNKINISITNVDGIGTNYSITDSMVDMVQSSYVNQDSKAQLTFYLKDNSFSYEMTMSENNCVATIKIYQNIIKNIEIGSDDSGEYIKIQGLKNITHSIVEKDNQLSFTLNYTANSLDDFSFINSKLKSISQVDYKKIDEQSCQLIINHTSNDEYYFEEYDNVCKIIFENTTTNKDNISVKIPVPNSVKESSIADEDRYLDKKIIFTLPGDLTSTIRTSTISTNSEYVSAVDVAYTSGNTVITIQTNRICGYRYSIKDGYLRVELDKPGNIYDKIVLLDPGHGGSAPGAIYFNTQEKDLTLEILYNKCHALFEDYGIKAYYTRTTDATVANLNRPKMSDAVDADLFISLHMNASSTASAAGSEAYYDTNKTATMNGLTSKYMAEAFSKNLSNVLNTKNRGAKVRTDLIVLKYNTVPSVLVELGFISNQAEMNKIKDATYQKQVAECIVTTIADFFEDYPTGR